MNSVEELDVFKLAHELALKIYSVTKKFPREEMYSLSHRCLLVGADRTRSEDGWPYSVVENILALSKERSAHRAFAGP